MGDIPQRWLPSPTHPHPARKPPPAQLPPSQLLAQFFPNPPGGHAACTTGSVVGTPLSPGNRSSHPLYSVEIAMTWTKPEAEIVAVTMEVTAYVATL
ncbi:MAG: pyrroloquinoline quinone precursor peptide PqqA [Gemmatimonadetes bacterium]|nr:pyrroloquinoline quinone precursor peptide PqqA [Gemmatimonadota bacterium]